MPDVQRLCSVNVDLDAIRHYRAIHGLTRRANSEEPWLALAVERLSKWADYLNIPFTWFVVGRDLDDLGLSEALLGLYRRGHELGNHSLDHFYDLTRRGRDVMREQLLGGSERISRLTGKASHGFRAPGYTLTQELYAILRECAVPYDSSVFPCPIYYAAKAVALFGQRLMSRHSQSILDSRQVLSAPTQPYRMGDSYWQLGHGMLELPIQVTRGPRLPFIGTTLSLLGPVGAQLLTRGVIGQAFVNLELHAIDALDMWDGLEELARVQPDLRIPWRRKLDTMARVIRLLEAHEYQVVTLERATLGLASNG